ncbi:transglycosylase SLT domain-containing protein [Marinobacter sp. C2H3]|uniref:transglycosylase SLT domain-containing protein n=1 Tax=Marinobacter sp. C2H3 TaxID=3119003 RepID=UPI00300ED002
MAARSPKRQRNQQRRRWRQRLQWTLLPALGVVVAVWATLRLSLLEPGPPANPDNLCEVFREHTAWYDAARQSQDRWGTPIATQMAFVYYESSFQSHARPPRSKLWGLIPWTRPSSAFGYVQALDPAWQEYVRAVDGGWLTVRSNMVYALDFVGWYNHLSHTRLGIPLTDPRRLYLAYHEGRGGYEAGSHAAKPAIRSLATRVRNRAFRYDNQLQQCEQEFQCWRWYQVWPFCSTDEG